MIQTNFGVGSHFDGLVFFFSPSMLNLILCFSWGRLAATVFEQSTFMWSLFTEALVETYTEIYATI